MQLNLKGFPIGQVMFIPNTCVCWGKTLSQDFYYYIIIYGGLGLLDWRSGRPEVNCNHINILLRPPRSLVPLFIYFRGKDNLLLVN